MTHNFHILEHLVFMCFVQENKLNLTRILNTAQFLHQNLRERFTLGLPLTHLITLNNYNCTENSAVFLIICIKDLQQT